MKKFPLLTLASLLSFSALAIEPMPTTGSATSANSINTGMKTGTAAPSAADATGTSLGDKTTMRKDPKSGVTNGAVDSTDPNASTYAGRTKRTAPRTNAPARPNAPANTDSTSRGTTMPSGTTPAGTAGSTP